IGLLATADCKAAYCLLEFGVSDLDFLCLKLALELLTINPNTPSVNPNPTSVRSCQNLYCQCPILQHYSLFIQTIKNKLIMKNFMKKLGVAIFAMAMIWSCGKDDAPTPPKNAAPVIIAQEFTVKADITDTFVIGTVIATDADKDALTFSIKTNDDDLFAITSSGALTLAQGKSLDFATKAQHSITVEVSDGEDSATATITIKVTEVVTDPQNS